MFIKLTEITDNETCIVNTDQIIFIHSSIPKGSRVATNYYMGYIYVKETPEEILKLIKECGK